ncbi:forkhead box protein C1 [Alligator sinensis]|uniref:Forkhead box protein C1 n=1 Tax=Alligator sinensis TaxID=38654 RepID=A0A3Q0FSE7_ALLSI|nr:forkhead box protein C1 [Alligator sinensis]
MSSLVAATCDGQGSQPAAGGGGGLGGGGGGGSMRRGAPHSPNYQGCLDAGKVENHQYNIIEKGEENCGPLIEAHKECMRALGFKV